MSVYDELIDVIGTGPGAEQIVRYRASSENQSQVKRLLEGAKTGLLSHEETAELDRYLQLGHLVRLAKARAHLYLQQLDASAGGNQ